MIMRRLVWKIVLLLLLVSPPALAMAQPQATSPGAGAAPPSARPANPANAANAALPAPVDSSYRLGAGDLVELSLVGRSDFNNRARVSTDGTILLPLVGSIHAADRTVLELADDVRQALIKGGFYADPVVRSEVVGISSRYVTVLGSVGAPGLLPLDRNYRLSEILAKVGGRAPGGAEYILLTRGNGAAERYYINRLASGGPDQDPIVTSGDKIFIPAGDSEVYYLSGQVKSPGNFPIVEGITVRIALAKAGGLTETGSEKKIKIVRDGKELKNVKLDDPIKVGDIITVGERLF